VALKRLDSGGVDAGEQITADYGPWYDIVSIIYILVDDFT
jgi:hypothetical protein